MAIDPRNLRPADLARLLNSTPLGTVIGERQLYRHRMRAGFRIGDGRRVSLLRYAAWLVEGMREVQAHQAMRIRHDSQRKKSGGGALSWL